MAKDKHNKKLGLEQMINPKGTAFYLLWKPCLETFCLKLNKVGFYNTGKCSIAILGSQTMPA